MEVTLTLVLAATILGLLAITALVRRSYNRTARRLIRVLDKYSDREIARQEGPPTLRARHREE